MRLTFSLVNGFSYYEFYRSHVFFLINGLFNKLIYVLKINFAVSIKNCSVQ